MKNYNLSKNKSLTIAVRCDTYKEALDAVFIYKTHYETVLFDWTESQPFLCISPKLLPAQFVNHYYAKENGLEVVQFSDFLRDNSLVAEAGKVNGSSGDGTGQRQDYIVKKDVSPMTENIIWHLAGNYSIDQLISIKKWINDLPELKKQKAPVVEMRKTIERPKGYYVADFNKDLSELAEGLKSAEHNWNIKNHFEVRIEFIKFGMTEGNNELLKKEILKNTKQAPSPAKVYLFNQKNTEELVAELLKDSSDIKEKQNS